MHAENSQTRTEVATGHTGIGAVSRLGTPAVWALVCTLTVLTWQAATVHYNYKGNWTALFCTGANLPAPETLAAEQIWRFPNSNGWDGQFYHYIAHDPLLLRDTGKYIDAPRLRYRRILIPAAAYLLAAGNPEYIDFAYRSVVLVFFFLGAYWLGCLAEMRGWNAAWSLAFFFLPAAIVSTDRLAIDAGLAALCMGFAFYSRDDEHPWAVYAVLIAAGLARDTGVLLTAAYCSWLVVRREFGRAALFGTAVLPQVCWYLYINSRTVPYRYDGALWLPLTGALHRLFHPMPYPFSPALNLLIHSFDVLAVCGMLAAFALGIRGLRKHTASPVGWAVVFFLALALFVWRPGDWLEAFDYGRILSPLLAFLALEVLEGAPIFYVAPLAMILPRFGLQMGSQVLGVAKGLAGII